MKIFEIVLLLMYLNAYERRADVPGGVVYETFPSYSLENIDTLVEKGFINWNGSSIVFSEEGKRFAERIKYKAREFLDF